jgi:hypothetical protein
MTDQSHLDDSEHWRARAKDLADRAEARPHSSSSKSTVAGVSDCVCEVPAGWNAIAEANSLAMEEDEATRKSLYSGSPSRIEG